MTAGLIGGRVGNKGGVGISLNMAGSTFLFINAHLAAHEGRLPNRLANLSKIKVRGPHFTPPFQVKLISPHRLNLLWTII